jgi:hypothetical protein
LLPRTALADAAQCWQSLRSLYNLKAMLAQLWTRFKTSLLGDYQCLISAFEP